MHKYYSRKNRIRKGVALVLMVTVATIIMNLCTAEKPAWDVCYEMANQNIEWTYARRTD